MNDNASDTDPSRRDPSDTPPFGIAVLMEALAAQPEASVTFTVGEYQINPGYHLTEVKFARVQSMDCAKHTDAWNELIIQLFDGNESSILGFMGAAKIKGIVGTALDALPEDANPRLFFEFSPQHGPLQKLTIQDISHQGQVTTVHLHPETTRCKPFDRWKLSTAQSSSSPSTSKRACCSG